LGYFRVFPNLFVVLVSPPGRCRKNIAIKAGTDLLSGFPDIKISAESITREALIKALKEAETVLQQTDGKMYVHSSLTVISEELSVFLGHANFGLMALLTDLYDAPESWEYRTKSQGTDHVYGIWLNILAGSTPTWLSGSIPLSAIGGGFTSRIIFVVEEDVRQRTAFLQLSEKELIIKDCLVHDLGEITTMKGEFSFTKDAVEFYSHWYNNERPVIVNDRIAGYFERKHIHVLKVASIISACRSNEMIITKDHIETAIALLTMLEPKMIYAFGAVGRSALTPDVDQVLKLLVSSEKGLTKDEILKTVWRDVDPRLIDVVLKSLIDMGSVKTELNEKKEIIFKLTS
jgi:hypothetical protein